MPCTATAESSVPYTVLSSAWQWCPQCPKTNAACLPHAPCKKKKSHWSHSKFLRFYFRLKVGAYSSLFRDLSHSWLYLHICVYNKQFPHKISTWYFASLLLGSCLQASSQVFFCSDFVEYRCYFEMLNDLMFEILVCMCVRQPDRTRSNCSIKPNCPPAIPPPSENWPVRLADTPLPSTSLCHTHTVKREERGKGNPIPQHLL